MSTKRSSKRGANAPLPGQLDLFALGDGAPSAAALFPTMQPSSAPSRADAHPTKRGRAGTKRPPASGLAEERKSSPKPEQPRRVDTIKSPKISNSAMVPNSRRDQRDLGAGRDLLDTRAAARLLGLGASTLEKMRSQKRGPRYVKLTNAAVRYHPDALEAWVASRIHAPSEEKV